MGFAGVSFWELLIILVIVLLLFGTRLRTLGTDLGMAVKGFRDAMSDGERDQDKTKAKSVSSEHTDDSGNKDKS